MAPSASDLIKVLVNYNHAVKERLERHLRRKRSASPVSTDNDPARDNPDQEGFTGDAVPNSPERRLVAVLHADIVGYSRLIGIDDRATAARVRHLFQSVIRPLVAHYEGRIVNTAGDSFLAEFSSINKAVRSAITLQEAIVDQEAGRREELRIRFRMGINIGDVIAEGDELFGDGINVAARLQAACPPERVCVSRAVRDHIGDRFDFAFDSMGSLRLKNIAGPVEAFLVRRNETRAGWHRPERPMHRGGVSRVFLGSAMLILFLGGAVVLFINHNSQGTNAENHPKTDPKFHNLPNTVTDEIRHWFNNR